MKKTSTTDCTATVHCLQQLTKFGKHFHSYDQMWHKIKLFTRNFWKIKFTT